MRIPPACVSAFLLAILAACGGSGSGGGAGGTSPNPAPPPPPTPPPPVTIEVPMIAADVVAGSTVAGSGDATVRYDEANAEIEISVTLTDVDADAVTLRSGHAGTSGDVVHTLSAGTSAGEWQLAFSPLTAADVTALESGALYLLASTAANPDGALRGQILPAGVELARVDLTPEQVASPGTSTASGRAWITFDGNATTITVHAVTADLDDAVSAEVRRAFAGADGPVIATLAQDPADADHWSFDTSDLTTELEAAAAGGELYLLVASTTEPDGAIRGQYLPEGFELVITDLDDAAVVMGASARSLALAGRVMTTIGADALVSHANLFTIPDAAAVELRQAPAGQNGPLLTSYEPDSGDATHWMLTDVTIDGLLAASLDNRTLYVQVATAAAPEGAARGQIVTAASANPADSSAFVVVTIDPPNAATLEAAPERIDAALNREPLPSSVSPAAVQIDASGGDGSFGDGNETGITPSSVGASGNVIEISLAGVPLEDDVYRVRISGGGTDGVVDAAGIPLDGDGDGMPGGSFESAFAIETPAVMATFSEIQETIFTPTCATSGCHSGSNPPDGLDLTAGAAYANIVNVASVQMPSLLRIAPGNPDDSYLVRKVQGTGIVASRMPLGQPPLSQAQINLIRAWVEDGAPDN
ncbi:MAG: CHRD domain-containing protein [Woeseiaceae bacterium]|nr:CHRD domain-containing protein [Woeseiaceae bacterium]